MSPVTTVCIIFLFFAVTSGTEPQQNEKVLKRNRRSLLRLNTMFKAVTGHDGSEFINYGNWCGLGGNGTPVDPLDGCCQSHDICYDELMKTTCKDREKNAVYRLNYEWKKDDSGEQKGVASCDLECMESWDEKEDNCASTICLCDVVLTNCMKQNLPFYNEKNYHKLGLFEMLQEGNYIANLM